MDTSKFKSQLARHNPSNLGKWVPIHSTKEHPRFGGVTTYKIAADYLIDCDLVEDWGCGLGMFRQYCRTQYRGVDGTRTGYADVVADLATYTSEADGILLRHVLEHNMQWEAIFQNALKSFRKKLCLVIFTPFEATTRVIAYHPKIDVVDISFSRDDLMRPMKGFSIDETTAGTEHLFFVRR